MILNILDELTDTRGVTGRPAMDAARAQNAVRELLLVMGEDPQREGLRDTTARVARMFQELCAGLGLSKLSRIVDAYARRPQIQERLTGQIADVLMEHTGAEGTYVYVT